MQTIKGKSNIQIQGDHNVVYLTSDDNMKMNNKQLLNLDQVNASLKCLGQLTPQISQMSYFDGESLGALIGLIQMQLGAVIVAIDTPIDEGD